MPKEGSLRKSVVGATHATPKSMVMFGNWEKTGEYEMSVLVTG